MSTNGVDFQRAKPTDFYFPRFFLTLKTIKTTPWRVYSQQLQLNNITEINLSLFGCACFQPAIPFGREFIIHNQLRLHVGGLKQEFNILLAMI